MIKKPLRILVIHEVDYFKKVIFEFQIIPEIFSLMGHNVFVVDYLQGEASSVPKIDYGIGGFVFEKTGRVYQGASVNIMRPLFAKSRFKRLYYFFCLRSFIEKIMREKKIDVILLYAVPTNGLHAVALAQQHKIPILFRLIDVAHQIVPYKFYKIPTFFIEKYIYKRCDLILALTPKLKDYAIKMGAKSKNVKVQLSGVDTDKFKSLPKNYDLAAKWGIEKSDKIVLFMGTLYDFSNLDWLAENWEKVLGAMPRAKLLIVGNGPLFKKLKGIIQKNKLEKSVILTDWQSYELLPDFINLADVCINLFEINDITRDIIPTKLFQYFACAKPVIAFRLPGMSDILKDEEDGVVYPQNNQEAISYIIKLLVCKDDAERIGRNGFNLVQKNYNWNRVVENIIAYIDELMKTRFSKL